LNRVGARGKARGGGGGEARDGATLRSQNACEREHSLQRWRDETMGNKGGGEEGGRDKKGLSWKDRQRGGPWQQRESKRNREPILFLVASGRTPSAALVGTFPLWYACM